MTGIRSVLFRLKALTRSRQRDREFHDEVASHLEEATDDYIRQGLPPEEARRAAHRRFGGVSQTTEVYRQVGSFMWLEELSRDIRYAVSTLRRSPAFTTTATVTLALAIGANTAMFSVLNSVLLRPLPYRAPEQLAMLWTEDPTQNRREGRSALWDVEQWQGQSQTFADMATFDAVTTVLSGPEGTEQITGASISPNLLPLLGVRPALGRNFSPDEGGEQQPVVLVSHRFWQARLGGANGAIGSSLLLDGIPAQVIGILPADFRVGTFVADVWKPHTTTRRARGPETWFVIGRLRPTATFDQAQAEMSTIARRVNQQLPATERSQGIGVVPLSQYVVGPQSRLALWMLAAAVFGVFLIAAGNVTSLSLARSTARAREIAVRAALGASANRIVRQLFTESAVLGVIAGVIGTLLASLAITLIRAFGPADLPRLNEVSLDSRVLGVTVALSLLAGILVGVAPAMTAGRRDLRPSRAEGGRSVAGGVSSRRLRRALVVAEFALAIVLLVGAGLLLRSWWHVTGVDAGFRPAGVVVMNLTSPPTLSVAAQRNDLFQRVLEEIQALPGVESAGIIDDLFTGNAREMALTVERNTGTVSERLLFTRDEVSTGFFQTLGTPLLGGRFFSLADRPEAPRVAIVNEALARRAWPGQDPVGRRLKLGPQEAGSPWFTVVGVVANMRRQGLEREPLPQMFVSLTQNPASPNMDVYIRTSSDDPLAMAGALRAAVGRVDRNAAISGVAPLELQLGSYLTQRRFQTGLLVGLSVVALLMAAVGIYGLIQYSVEARAQEIGLRMAIGAQRGHIFRMMIGEGLTLSLAGVAVGLVGAAWLARVGSSLLVGVTATDPLTFAAVALLLTAATAAACYFPARRAMSVDPIVTLRAM